MQYTILLDRTENIKNFEAQEQSRFVYTVLEALGVPAEWDNPDEPMSVEQKRKFRKICEDYSISIVDDTDGGVKIFDDKGLVGEWFKCKYKFKEDHSHPNPKKRMYMEANLNFWARFEEEEENAE